MKENQTNAKACRWRRLSFSLRPLEAEKRRETDARTEAEGQR